MTRRWNAFKTFRKMRLERLSEARLTILQAVRPQHDGGGGGGDLLAV
jgi:hypothetical protein